MLAPTWSVVISADPLPSRAVISTGAPGSLAADRSGGSGERPREGEGQEQAGGPSPVATGKGHVRVRVRNKQEGPARWQRGKAT